MRPDIAPGNPFPDYGLPDHTKTQRRLSALQGNDPMLAGAVDQYAGTA